MSCSHVIQIAESFRRFGISDETKHILAIKLSNQGLPSLEDVDGHLGKHVQGQRVNFNDDEISQLHDLARLKKIYKFELPKNFNSSTSTGSGIVRDALPSVLGAMALKGT